MLKTKDGYAKVIGTSYLGSSDYLLLSNGDSKAISSLSVNYATSAGNAATSMKSEYSRSLLGRSTSGNDYDTNSSNLVFAEWNTMSDSRWYLKATGYECRVAYANNADTVDGYHASSFATAGHTHNIYAANENYGGFTKSGRLPISGFYQSNESESGGNAPWSGWMHLINCLHSNTGNNYALLIAASFSNNNTFKIRVTNNNVNNTWRDIIHSGNIGSQTVANAYHLRINSANTWSTWNWSGLSGQPSWLWGSNDGTNMYVWNPSNFRVAYATSAGNADTVDGYHAYQLFRDLGWWNSSETHNANDISGNGAVFAYSTHSNVPVTGVLTTFSGEHDGYNWQMSKAYTNRALYIRQRNGDNGTWSNWVRLLDENDLVWDKIIGKPSSFTPSAHNHDGRYLRLDGSDTMTGVLKVKANQYNDGYDGAINMNNSDIYGLNSIYTVDKSDTQAEGIHFWRDSTHVDTLRMMDGKLLFTPNRPLGGSGTEQTVLHTGNSYIKGGVITINGSSLTPLTSLPSHSHSWDSITGKPTSFTPSSHTHSWISITDKIVAGNEFNIVNAGFTGDMWINYVPINDRSITATITGYYFGNGHQGLASVTASGFVKNGSSSSYVLLGDGSHQTISSLSVNHATSAGNADTLDGTHLNGIFTAFGNDENNISATVGGVTKKFEVKYSNHSYYSRFIKGDDLRNANNAPNYYMNTFGNASLCTEFSLQGKLFGNGTYVNLITSIPWNDPSGGRPVQLAMGNHIGLRSATNDSTWGAWRTIPTIDANGVMEIGKFIDWHWNNEIYGSQDFSTRLQALNTSSYPNTVYLPTQSGELALLDLVELSLYHVVDMRNYDSGYWHPVTVELPRRGYNKIKVSVELNIGDKPSWATHSAGFTCNMEIWATAHGWGTTNAETICLNYTYGHCNSNPCGWMLLGYPSLGVLFLRGGARYKVWTDFDAPFTPHDKTYTWTSEGGTTQSTGGPYTNCPGLDFAKNIIYANLNGTAENSDKLDGYHASYSSNTPWGTIPVITAGGWMDIGKHLEFHHDNTTGLDYSTLLTCTGNYANIVNLPSKSGTLALTNDVLTFSNENADYLNASFNNPDFSKKAASKYIECYDDVGGWWNWMAGKFMKAGSSDNYVLLGGGGHKLISDFATSNHTHPLYLPLAGGTMTGNISYKGSKNTYEMIKFIDNNVDVYGNGICIGGGGLTIIGGGESAATVLGQHTNGGDENMIIANDNAIDFFSNMNSGWGLHKAGSFDTSGYWNGVGFKKNNSNDNYVLTGGGGHTAISGLSVNYANSAGNADKVDGYHASNLVKFYLSPMASNASADSAKSWFINTMPSASGAIVYNVPGAEKTIIAGKSSGAHGHMLQLNYNDTYLRILRYYDGSWKSTDWEKISAGYADSAGSVAWSNITDRPSSLKNPYSLNIFGVTYDGSAAKTVTTSTFVSLLSEGTSTVTDGTMFITSWASDSGFSDTSAVNVPYKRKASCLWSYIDSKVSSKYLPLAGGTMNGNARIGHDSGSLYIGNSGNDGWIYTQDIASLNGTDNWAIRTSGAAHFGNVYICTKSDHITYDTSIIECYSDTLYLNYYSSRGVNLCNGGGTVQIGPYTTGDTGNNKLYVNGSEFINGASNVKDHVFANGFRHRSHNSNDSVLLAGGGYSQGVPVRYWAIYYMYIGNSSTDVTYTKRSGNYDFITSEAWESEGSARFDIRFPSGYNKNNTLIFGNGDHRTSSSWKTPVYVTITTSPQFGSESQIRVMISNDASLDVGFANIYFMCMG